MKTPTDQEMELLISRMLRVGTSLSAAVVLAGALLSFRNSSEAAPVYASFHPQPSSLHDLQNILHRTASLDGSSVIQLGLLLLIATPVVRVAFCVFGFARQRNRLYVVISSAVLLILTYSLTQGGR